MTKQNLGEGRTRIRIFFQSLILFSILLLRLPYLSALTSYVGNYAVPEDQPGYVEEQYEIKATRKLHRGLENFFLSPLEIPHGVKTEYARRKSEYLPVGIESFFIGTFNGFLNGFKRAGVGLYEIVTFPYAQGPILEEMKDWLY